MIMNSAMVLDQEVDGEVDLKMVLDQEVNGEVDQEVVGTR